MKGFSPTKTEFSLTFFISSMLNPSLKPKLIFSFLKSSHITSNNITKLFTVNFYVLGGNFFILRKISRELLTMNFVQFLGFTLDKRCFNSTHIDTSLGGDL